MVRLVLWVCEILVSPAGEGAGISSGLTCLL